MCLLIVTVQRSSPWQPAFPILVLSPSISISTFPLALCSHIFSGWGETVCCVGTGLSMGMVVALLSIIIVHGVAACLLFRGFSEVYRVIVGLQELSIITRHFIHVHVGLHCPGGVR